MEVHKTVLVGWEMGGGLGHIHRLLPIATQLAAKGHRIVFALKSKIDAAVITRALPNTAIFDVPIIRGDPARGPAPSAYNYADILYRRGYTSAMTLSGLIKGWRQLFDAFRPSVLVCDHSPTAILAAAGRLPTIHIGSGFAIPPVNQPFPLLHRSTQPGAKEREAKVLETIREVQTRLNIPPIDHVSQLFASAENFPCCLPELDPYHSHRVASSRGTAQPLPKVQPIPQTPFLFGYLNGQEKRLPEFLQSLVRAKVPAGIYIRRALPALAHLVTGSSVTVYENPQKMPDALIQASATLHHGGLATSEAALAMGRPQFVLPRHLEQGLTATAIQALGCGLNLAQAKGDPGQIISAALKAETFCKKAEQVAQRIAQRTHEDMTAAVVNACLKHLS